MTTPAGAEDFDLWLDVGSALARIEQLGREGADTAGGLVLDRLITCDGPRLREHFLRHAPQDLQAALEAAMS